MPQTKTFPSTYSLRSLKCLIHEEEDNLLLQKDIGMPETREKGDIRVSFQCYSMAEGNLHMFQGFSRPRKERLLRQARKETENVTLEVIKSMRASLEGWPIIVLVWEHMPTPLPHTFHGMPFPLGLDGPSQPHPFPLGLTSASGHLSYHHMGVRSTLTPLSPRCSSLLHGWVGSQDITSLLPFWPRDLPSPHKS
ncbi:uncharacterized protein LOC135091633 [Scylla paramamosain]|uniref:uncharacterized protein LOC135091633 n=1 Tax=Scylla paramamosain TaxID=85552 RepID=UPI003082C6E6